jgi:hypothetical protein
LSKTSKVIITVWVTAMALGFVALIIGGLLWRPILLPAIAVLMVGMVLEMSAMIFVLIKDLWF